MALIRLWLVALLCAIGFVLPASAQSVRTVTTCGTLASPLTAGLSPNLLIIDVNGNLCTAASVSASISGFAPGSAYASLTSSASSAQVALPSGAVVAAFNTGTTAVSCVLNTTTATGVANRNIIQAGSWFAFTVGSNTNIGCINQAGDAASNVVVLSGGTGLPTGAGGGGGSGGGGGAVTAASGAYVSGSIASGAMVDLGAVADAAATAGSTGTLSAKLRLMTTQLGTINTTLGTPLQAGGSIANISGTVSLPTGAATSANQSTAITSLGTIATNSGTQATAANQTSIIGTKAAGTAAASSALIGGVFNTSLPTLTTGQQAAAQFDSSGRLIVNIGAGASSGAVAQGSTTSGQTGSLVQCAVTTSAPTYTTAQTSPVSCDTSGNTRVIVTNNGVAQAATTSGTTISPVGGGASTSEPTAVTDGQIARALVSLTGKTITLPYAVPEYTLNGQISSAMTGTTSTAVTGMGAQGAGIRNYVTACTFSNTHATVGTMINLQDGSGGTVLWQAPAAAVYGGAAVQFPTPIKTTANTGLFAVNATTGASTFVSCTGYKGV